MPYGKTNLAKVRRDLVELKQQLERYTEAKPCPVCGGHPEMERGKGTRCHGFLSGQWAFCSREEQAGNLEPDAAGLCKHRRVGDCPCGDVHGEPEMVASYEYRDEHDKLLYEVVRYEPKDFRIRRRIGNSGNTVRWDLGKDTPRVLYNLGMVLGAHRDTPILLVEGEKDVHNLLGAGFVATTNVFGAGSWRKEYTEALRGRRVVILPDNDGPGMRHAGKIGDALYGVAESIKVLRLPDLQEHGDVSDWLLAGGTASSLQELIDDAPPWTPDQDDGSVEDSLTDTGNAYRLVTRHGKNLRYCHPWKQWLVWNGRRWKPDAEAEVYRKAEDAVGSIGEEIRAHPERSKALAAWLKQSLSRARLENMVALATKQEPVSILPERLDSDPFLLNCINGTVDLRTGDLRPHSREDYLTKSAAAEFDPDARCDLWHSFLKQVLPDVGLRHYIQRVAGYALTGDVSEACLFFLYGTGANGKTTFLNTLMHLLRDYASPAPRDLLFKRGLDSHPTGMATLFGKRFVTCVENELGQQLAESFVKQITGGDKLMARRLYQDYWEFDPSHKIFLASNYKPVILGDDNAIWRRIKVIPFVWQVPQEKMDKRLESKLWKERTGILAWAIEGCLKWQQEAGLHPPAAVQEAVQEYEAESDSVGQWLDDRTARDRRARTPSSDLYDDYESYCDVMQMPAQSIRVFADRLKREGLRNYRYREQRVWEGIVLSSPAT